MRACPECGQRFVGGEEFCPKDGTTLVALETEETDPLVGVTLDGRYAIALEVYKESTDNTVEVVHAVHHVLDEEVGRDPLLEGINLFVWQDQAEEITSGIDGLKSALAQLREEESEI